MRLTEEEISRIQTLFIEGTPQSEIGRYMRIDRQLVKYHCRALSPEPVKRLEWAEMLYYVYVKTPLDKRTISIDAAFFDVKESPELYPRLSKLSQTRFMSMLSSLLNELGWERNATTSSSRTFWAPEQPKPVVLEW